MKFFTVTEKQKNSDPATDFSWLAFTPRQTTVMVTGALSTVGSKHAGHDMSPWSRRDEGEALSVRREPKHGEPHRRLGELGVAQNLG